MSFEDEVNFCLNFLRNQDVANQPCIYSPSAILNSLAVLYAGSEGKTAEQLAAVIGKNKRADKIIDYYSKSIKIITDSDKDDAHASPPSKRAKTDTESKTNKFKILIANGIFFNKNIEISQSFQNTFGKKLNGHLQNVDFQKNKKNVVKTINKFVEDSTEKIISKVFESDDIEKDNAVIMINAVSFVGRWEIGFLHKTTQLFYSTPKRRQKMMSKFSIYNITDGEDWKCGGIPYKDKNIWFFIVLPKKRRESLADLLKKIDYSMFLEMTKRNIQVLNLTMPIFDIDSTYDLTDTLPKMGVQGLFGANCNLSKMMSPSQPISKSLHKAVFSVDQYGTRADPFNVPRSAPAMDTTHHLKANRPFLYFIVKVEKDKPPTNILFAGSYC